MAIRWKQFPRVAVVYFGAVDGSTDEPVLSCPAVEDLRRTRYDCHPLFLLSTCGAPSLAKAVMRGDGVLPYV